MGKVLAIIGLLAVVAVGYYMFDGKRGNVMIDNVSEAVEATADNVGDAAEDVADDIDDAADKDPN